MQQWRPETKQWIELDEALQRIGFCRTDITGEYSVSAEPLITIRGYFSRYKEKKTPYTPSRILKSGNRTIVFWADGTKTIVKRADDETESDYAAFTAALGIKTFGSNSALKRIVERTETQKRKKNGENVIDRHDEPVTEEQVKQKEDDPNG